MLGRGPFRKPKLLPETIADSPFTPLCDNSPRLRLHRAIETLCAMDDGEMQLTSQLNRSQEPSALPNLPSVFNYYSHIDLVENLDLQAYSLHTISDHLANMSRQQAPPGGSRKISFNVSDQYDIQDVVGEGAYGVVW